MSAFSYYRYKSNHKFFFSLSQNLVGLRLKQVRFSRAEEQTFSLLLLKSSFSELLTFRNILTQSLTPMMMMITVGLVLCNINIRDADGNKGRKLYFFVFELLSIVFKIPATNKQQFNTPTIGLRLN